jgi:hypothetical protein
MVGSASEVELDRLVSIVKEESRYEEYKDKLQPLKRCETYQEERCAKKLKL